MVTEEPDNRDGWRSRLLSPRIVAGAVLVCLLIAAYFALRQSDMWNRLLEGEALKEAVLQLGPAGPALIIGLITLAIVMSPIPSAPIALASGAAYGHLWGTLYVAVGSEAGALIAFGIARFIGFDAVREWLGARPQTTFLDRFLRSQNKLMAAVFASRLIPFLSFDIISYAAGLTPLKAWRFALATLLGIVPASFLLAHFGDELASRDLERAGLTVLALGLITLLPVAWKATPSRWRSALSRFAHLE